MNWEPAFLLGLSWFATLAAVVIGRDPDDLGVALFSGALAGGWLFAGLAHL